MALFLGSSNHLGTVAPVNSIEEIVERNHSIFHHYSITRVWLFGSFARKEQIQVM